MKALGKAYGLGYNISENLYDIAGFTKKRASGTIAAPAADFFEASVGAARGIVQATKPTAEALTGRDFEAERKARPEPGTTDTFKKKPKGFVGDFAGTIEGLATTDFSKISEEKLISLAKKENLKKPARQLSLKEAAGTIVRRKGKRGNKAPREKPVDTPIVQKEQQVAVKEPVERKKPKNKRRRR